MDAPADLTNWRRQPFNQWAFRNIPALIPVAEVPALGPTLVLAEAPADLSGFSLSTPKGPLSLEAVLGATATDGVVVLKDGRVVFETYAHGLDAATPHILMSATKSVTGLLAGVLADRGELDLAAPIETLVPETVDSPFAGATLRDLIDMRGGVRLDLASQEAYNNATHWEGVAAEGLRAFYAGLKGPPVAHGGPFAYVSANTDLVGLAMERATGRGFADLLSELIWTPMGAEHDAFITTDGHGAARATGGLCATTRDFARLGQRVLEGGAGVLPEAWLEDIVHGGDARAWAEGEFAKGFPGMSMRYRSGWYVVDAPTPMIFAMGIHGQNLFVDRAAGLVVAKVSSQDDPTDPRAIGLTHRMVAELRRLLT